MRKLLLFLLTVSIAGASQSQNVVSASIYFPKADKVQEFEKGLAAHIVKYHSGDWKWRVSEIQTGPNAGGYHIVEGPKHWDEFDKRGNLGAEHMTDWNKTVAPYLTDRYENSFGVYEQDLSSVTVTALVEKIVITHVYPKPGMSSHVRDNMKRAQKAWAGSSQPVAVYRSVASGPSQFIIVYRLKEGLKELADDFRKPWKERYEAANGEGSLEHFMESIQKDTDHSWSEMLIFRSDLSAK